MMDEKEERQKINKLMKEIGNLLYESDLNGKHLIRITLSAFMSVCISYEQDPLKIVEYAQKELKSLERERNKGLH